MLYPPNVNQDESLSRPRKFVLVKLSTFEVLMVTHICYKMFHCLFKKEKMEKNYLCFSSSSQQMQSVSLPRQHMLPFFPASLLLNFFGVLVFTICLLERQNTLCGFQGPLTHVFYLFVKSVSAICVYPELVYRIFSEPQPPICAWGWQEVGIRFLLKHPY